MSGGAVRAALGELRRAQAELAARPFPSVLGALGELLEEFRDPASAPRRRLARELPAATGFTRPVVERGLALALEAWTGEALERTFADEVRAPGAARALPVCSVLLAGAIPSPTLLALVAPLAVRAAVLARPASRDPVTADVVAEALAARDAALAACLRVVRFDHADGGALDALLAADCVVLTGSDATVAAAAARVRGKRRVLRHGHRLSVAALSGAARGADLRRAAAALAEDVALWDQLGCLSPVAAYVVGGPEAAGAAGEALAEALEGVGRALPRGAVEPAAAAAIAHERALVELRRAAGEAATLHAGEGWTVAVEPDARPRPAPLHRFLRVHPVGDAAALVAALAPLAPHLASVGVDAPGPDLERALRRLGASRIAPLGKMQAPPLAWRRDGEPVLAPYLA